jgi:hypothetical protein
VAEDIITREELTNSRGSKPDALANEASSDDLYTEPHPCIDWATGLETGICGRPVTRQVKPGVRLTPGHGPAHEARHAR